MKKILIVEDDNTISNELKELLINSGYKAEVLEDFQNSKEKILESQADLILLDINIPGINGEILLKEIRKVSVYQLLWLQVEPVKWTRCLQCPMGQTIL